VQAPWALQVVVVVRKRVTPSLVSVEPFSVASPPASIEL
jgi:hypothetical protein